MTPDDRHTYAASLGGLGDMLDRDLRDVRARIDALEAATASAPPGAHPPGRLPSLRIDPHFSPAKMHAETLAWYARADAGIAQRGLDHQFDRNSNRPWNRTGNQHVTLLLLALRLTGDASKLDESIRLVELAWRRMSVVAAPERVGGVRRFWGGHDIDLDAILSAGLVAAVMWACYVNAGEHSPAGHDYGEVAFRYYAWLIDDFLPTWAHRDTLELRKYQQHTYANGTRIMHYLGRMGGAGRRSSSDYFAERDARMNAKLADDRFGAAGPLGRLCLVYSHVIGSETNAGGALQYTTYVGNEISAYTELAMEGFDDRLDERYFAAWANSLADLVCDDKGSGGGAGDRFARTIGGDLESDASNPCPGGAGSARGTTSLLGVPYNHCYRRRPPNHRLVLGAFALLAPYDTRGRIAPYIGQFYPYGGGTAEAPTEPGYALCQAVNLLRFPHGTAEAWG